MGEIRESLTAYGRAAAEDFRTIHREQGLWAAIGRVGVIATIPPYQVGGAEATIAAASIAAYETSGHQPLVAAIAGGVTSLVIERALAYGTSRSLRSLPNIVATYKERRFGKLDQAEVAKLTAHDVSLFNKVRAGLTFGSPGATLVSFVHGPYRADEEHLKAGNRTANGLTALNFVWVGLVTSAMRTNAAYGPNPEWSETVLDWFHSPYPYLGIVALINAPPVAKYAVRRRRHKG